MYVTKESLEALAFMLPYLERMPPEAAIEFADRRVQIQAQTQEKVRAVRQVFPGATLWVKQWNQHRRHRD